MSHSPEPEALSLSPSPSPPEAVIPPSKALPSLDLLHWSNSPPHNTPHSPRLSATSDSSAFMNASDERVHQQQLPRPVHRSNQPAGGISTISLGENPTPAESDRLFQRRRPGSDFKRREMTGSRIFYYEPEPKILATSIPAEKTLAKDVARSMPTQCTISTEDQSLSTKPARSISEAAKKRELSGSYLDAGEPNSSVRRPCSSAKSKELEGSNIFGRSTQYGSFFPKSSTNDLTEAEQENKAPRTSVKVSNPAGGKSQISFGSDEGQGYGKQSKRNLHDHKVAELLGNNIFENGSPLHGHNENKNTSQNERTVSAAKRREMLGNDIFSTANAFTPEFTRSDRQPPGGRSSLKLL